MNTRGLEFIRHCRAIQREKYKGNPDPYNLKSGEVKYRDSRGYYYNPEDRDLDIIMMEERKKPEWSDL